MKDQKFAPFLTFTGKAEEAMLFYVKVFPNAKITKLVRYEKNHPFAKTGEENKILFGSLSILGREIMFLDMDNDHPSPKFNWSISLFIECCNEAEFDLIFSGLAQDGTIMMGPEPVANFQKCAWVTDKFGVTWQTVLEY